jgi:hypothetical protein
MPIQVTSSAGGISGSCSANVSTNTNLLFFWIRIDTAPNNEEFPIFCSFNENDKYNICLKYRDVSGTKSFMAQAHSPEGELTTIYTSTSVTLTVGVWYPICFENVWNGLCFLSVNGSIKTFSGVLPSSKVTTGTFTSNLLFKDSVHTPATITEVYYLSNTVIITFTDYDDFYRNCYKKYKTNLPQNAIDFYLPLNEGIGTIYDYSKNGKTFLAEGTYVSESFLSYPSGALFFPIIDDITYDSNTIEELSNISDVLQHDGQLNVNYKSVVSPQMYKTMQNKTILPFRRVLIFPNNIETDITEYVSTVGSIDKTMYVKPEDLGVIIISDADVGCDNHSEMFSTSNQNGFLYDIDVVGMKIEIWAGIYIPDSQSYDIIKIAGMEVIHLEYNSSNKSVSFYCRDSLKKALDTSCGATDVNGVGWYYQYDRQYTITESSNDIVSVNIDSMTINMTITAGTYTRWGLARAIEDSYDNMVTKPSGVEFRCVPDRYEKDTFSFVVSDGSTIVYNYAISTLNTLIGFTAEQDNSSTIVTSDKTIVPQNSTPTFKEIVEDILINVAQLPSSVLEIENISLTIPTEQLANASENATILDMLRELAIVGKGTFSQKNQTKVVFSTFETDENKSLYSLAIDTDIIQSRYREQDGERRISSMLVDGQILNEGSWTSTYNAFKSLRQTNTGVHEEIVAKLLQSTSEAEIILSEYAFRLSAMEQMVQVDCAWLPYLDVGNIVFVNDSINGISMLGQIRQITQDIDNYKTFIDLLPIVGNEFWSTKNDFDNYKFLSNTATKAYVANELVNMPKEHINDDFLELSNDQLSGNRVFELSWNETTSFENFEYTFEDTVRRANK